MASLLEPSPTGPVKIQDPNHPITRWFHKVITPEITLIILVATILLLIILAVEFPIVRRFLTGEPLNGKPRSNSHFFRDGTRSTHISGYVTRWGKLAGWKRALINIGAASIILATLVSYLRYPGPTFYGIILTAIVGKIWLGYKVIKKVKNWHHQKHILGPMRAAIASRFAIQDPSTVRIDVDRTYKTDPEFVGTVAMPDGFAPTDSLKDDLSKIIVRKLGGNLDVRITDVGHPLATIMHSPEPPDVVPFDDKIRDQMRALGPSECLTGIAAGKKPVIVDFDSDTSNVGISSAPGGGKSVLMANFVIQLMEKNAVPIMLDYKGDSHPMLVDMDYPNLYTDIEDIHNMLVWLATVEFEKRKANPRANHQRYVVCVEEAPTLMMTLRMYWRQNKPRGQRVPNQSPAVDALLTLMAMGRQYKINTIIVAQYLTVKSVGGPEARACINYLFMLRSNNRVWKNLAQEIWPPPAFTNKRGRADLVSGGNAIRFQVVGIEIDARKEVNDVKAAIAYATSGHHRPCPRLLSPGTSTEPSPGVDDGNTGTREQRHLEAVRLPSYTWQEAEQIIPMNYQAIKQARRRGRLEIGENEEWPASQWLSWYDDYKGRKVSA